MTAKSTMSTTAKVTQVTGDAVVKHGGFMIPFTPEAVALILYVIMHRGNFVTPIRGGKQNEIPLKHTRSCCTDLVCAG